MTAGFLVCLQAAPEESQTQQQRSNSKSDTVSQHNGEPAGLQRFGWRRSLRLRCRHDRGNGRRSFSHLFDILHVHQETVNLSPKPNRPWPRAVLQFRADSADHGEIFLVLFEIRFELPNEVAEVRSILGMSGHGF